MKVVYCPTEQMLADFFTKPLQGDLFRRIKAVVMGHKHTGTIKEVPSVAPQERVEGSMNLENSEDATDGRKTDKQLTNVLAPAPIIRKTKRSYAKVAKRRVSFQPHVKARLKSERREMLTPLTLRQ
jgi:hypothetical protein